jgi:type VII secretion protein EccE
VARDGAGWFAVAELGPVTPMRDEAVPAPALDVLVEALADTGQPGAVLQLVTHTVPAPSAELDPARPAARSYHELLHRYGTPVPADRCAWVAVRLDARTLAEAGATDAAQAPEVVAALLRRIGKALRRKGIVAEPLDAAGLTRALCRSCDLGDGPAPPPETWRTWHSDRLAHRAYWLKDWPAPHDAPALWQRIAATPAAFTSLALVLAPEGDGTDVRCLVRVAARPAALARACAALTRTVGSVPGARLFALDGEQGPAAYASAPTGGGPR